MNLRSRAVANAIKGSVIGLVAFLLGFAFSISFGRHDMRRQVVLNEANAAGTLYLRAGLLKENERHALRSALVRYVDERIRYFQEGPDAPAATQSVHTMDHLLQEVWLAVEAAHRTDPQVVLVSQVVPAANALIDLNATRAWTFRGRTPNAVLIVLMVSVLVAAGLIGHSFGQNQRRHPWLCVAFHLLFTMILYLILDFDGPRYGLIRLDHTPFLELKSFVE